MTDNSSQHQAADSLTAVTQGCDLMMLPTDTILTLTEADFEEVAAELGVEVAAIKAVVEIEAGRTHEGFASPGKPLINFDLSMFRHKARCESFEIQQITFCCVRVVTRIAVSCPQEAGGRQIDQS